MKRDITFLALGGGSLLLSFFAPAALPVNPAWLAILLCGAPIVREAAVGLFTRFDIKADVLVSLALLASVAIGEIFAAGEIAFIMQLGSLLEERTVAKARVGIEKLVRLTPRTARRVTAAGEESIPAKAVAVGDRLRVLPGETIPVDGVVRAGQTSVNQAVMTGESLPVDKGPGDEVFSGTVNQFGSFEMEAARVGEDSSIQRMIRLVQSADAGKAKIVGLADRWATWIVVAALASAALTWLFSGQVIRAVTILVVFCPCALVLATPTAIMAAIGNATRHSFLVREGDALERLAQVGKAAFDKTGTLTRGVPEVTAVRSLSPGVTEEQVYAWLARAELGSEHPLGKAVVRGWQAAGGGTPAPAEDFEALPGRGLRAVLDGHTVLAGSEALLEEAGAALPPGGQSGGGGFSGPGVHPHLSGGGRGPRRLLRPGGHGAGRGGGHAPGPERGGGVPGAPHRRQRERRRPHRPDAVHSGVPGGVSAGGQAQLDRPGPAGGRPDLHGGRRHQRRPRPEKGLCGHRHGGRGQ